MARHLRIEAQELLAKDEGERLSDSEPGVVAERADIGNVVVDAFEFEEQRSQPGRIFGDLYQTRLLDREAIREVVADCGVARYALCEGHSVLDVAALEEALDAPMEEPQPSLHLEDGFSDHRKSEVPGLYEAAVHGTDRDLVDTGTLDLDERERTGVGAHKGRRSGVTAHRVPTLGPVLVEHERTEKRVPNRVDPEKVVHLPLEPARGKRELGEGWNRGTLGVDLHLQFDPSIRRSGHEQVDDSKCGPVIVRDD